MFLNRIIPALIICSLASFPGLMRAGTYTETVELEEDFEGGEAFYIETLSGSVKITGVKGSKVKVIAVKNARGGEKKAREALDELTIEMKRDHDRLNVVAEFPGEGGFFSHIFRHTGDHGDTWVDFEISIPSHLDVTVDATSAEVDVQNVTGDISLDLTSGGVVGESLGGDVVVDGTSGRIELKRVGGSIVIDNTSGEAIVRVCGGDVRVDKTSGNVFLAEIGGDVEVDGTSCNVTGEAIKGYITLNLISGDVNLTGVEEGLSFDNISGDIEVSFKEGPRRKSRVSSISGDVRLLILSESDLDIDLESVSGELIVELEGLRIHDMSRSSMRAATGEGNVRLSIETVSGDVEIIANGI